MILLGIVLGVVYGWIINPVRYTQTGLQTLRIDYRTDFVLMAAELYQSEGDLAGALARLSYLGADSPQDSMQEAIAYAEENNYAPTDLASMQALFIDIKRFLPPLE